VPRESTPAGRAALKRAVAAQRRMEKAAEAREVAKAERLAALQEAYEGGITLAAMGELLGLTPERVRQLLREP
jgi:hypothetical protein